jgi:hypothetical protein
MAQSAVAVTIKPMTGTPSGPPPTGSWQPPASPPAYPVSAKQSRVPVIIAISLAVIAVVVAIASWFRPVNDEPAEPAAPEYTAQEREDARVAMCEAYERARNALNGAGGQTSDDPILTYFIAVNTRLAIGSNAAYLRRAMLENPALDPSIAELFRRMAATYDDILMNQLAEAPAEANAELNKTLDQADLEASGACQ